MILKGIADTVLVQARLFLGRLVYRNSASAEVVAGARYLTERRKPAPVARRPGVVIVRNCDVRYRLQDRDKILIGNASGSERVPPNSGVILFDGKVLQACRRGVCEDLLVVDLTYLYRPNAIACGSGRPVRPQSS